ncbi:Protein disulfide-isomerase 2-like isoform X3 [Oopsacas minuta]|uniref:Protein disulfide-isomerase n=1 Tax=Oopsacas minuta TaxID=111878 RepID=A0AAV7JL34_9METZ|nr:Protein disulfide-isomerase 2-like isoform X3 [Oopsacas minuta]
MINFVLIVWDIYSNKTYFGWHLSMKLFLIISLVLISIASSEIIEEDNVLILTENNFNEALEKHNQILVEFYAPWCGHCKKFAPEYSQAAAKLKETGSEIRLGKVDASVYEDLAVSWDIKGFPTLIFFTNKSSMGYNGPREADGIIEWLNKKSKSPTTPIETMEELEKFSGTDNIAIVGFFKPENPATVYIGVARKIDFLQFGLCKNEELFDSDLAGKEGVIIYKGFDEKKVVFDQELNVEKLEIFLQIHQFELVSEFSEEVSARFGDTYIDKHLLLFAPKDDNNTKELIETLREIALEFRGQILVITVDTINFLLNTILDYFDVSLDEVPCLRSVVLSGEEVSRYKPDNTNLSIEGIRKFVQDFLAGKLKSHRKSEETPEDWDDEAVLLLTASNFNNIVLKRKSKKALVLFYSPSSRQSNELQPIWDKLGDHYGNDEDVIIAKIDASKNEVEGIKISSYPTIKYFPLASDEILDYTGERDLDSFIKYIETDSKDESEPKLVSETFEGSPAHEDL